jgi:ribosomal protein L11 methyltransferase
MALLSIEDYPIAIDQEPIDLSGNWKISAFAGRRTIEAALAAQEHAADWDPTIALSGCDAEPGNPNIRPDIWKLEAWLPRKPDEIDRLAIAALFSDEAPALGIEELPETDWVAESQRGIEPIRAGCFHIHTPEHPASEEPGTIDFTIPASQAFGTGQHETTSGCLAMLDAMKRRGVMVRNCADIGTGTGLLSFAALALWPGSLAIASDIDPVCPGVVTDNAALNGVMRGGRAGELVMVVADGMDNELIQTRAPYDLVMANILAGPLIELAPAFADALLPGGHLLLAGLLTSQEQDVRAAFFRAGLRLAGRVTYGEWSILWLRRRAAR